MDAAKTFVAQHTSKRGHHTDVEEYVKPAVTWETVKPTRHEELTTAVDREVHQDHYHTTVQPIAHKEVLPTQHIHNLIPVKDVEFRHGNQEETRLRLAQEAAQFKNTSIVEPVRESQAVLPVVTGEHVHHHVHEVVQPIIYKETVAPEVIHTTIPVHETHRAAAEHHGMSALPVRRLESFIGAGGVLDGHARETHEEYEGAPRQYDSKLSTTLEKLALGSERGLASDRNVGTGIGNTNGSGRHSTQTTTSTTTTTGVSTGLSGNHRVGQNTTTNTNSNIMKPSRRSDVSDSGYSGLDSRGSTAPNSPATAKFAQGSNNRQERLITDDNASTRSSGEYSTTSKKGRSGFLSKITGRSHE